MTLCAKDPDVDLSQFLALLNCNQSPQDDEMNVDGRNTESLEEAAIPERAVSICKQMTQDEQTALQQDIIDIAVSGNMNLLSKLLHCFEWNPGRVKEYLLELIQRSFMDDSSNKEILGIVNDFFTSELVYCEDLSCSLFVELLDYILHVISNPSEEIKNGDALVLLKSILERIGNEHNMASVAIFDQNLHPSSSVVVVMKYLIVESEWNCRLFLSHIIKLVSEINFALMTPSKDLLTSWIRSLFTKLEVVSVDDPTQVPTVFGLLCQFGCQWNAYEVLFLESDRLMKINQKLRRNEELRPELIESEAKCVNSFLQLLRLNPDLTKRLLKFVQSRLSSCTYIHMSTFFFSVCLSSLAPGSPTGKLFKESMSNLLKRQVSSLCENEQNARKLILFSQQLPETKSLEEYIDECIEVYKAGSAAYKLLEGIVSFGFLVLDNFGPHPFTVSSSNSSPASFKAPVPHRPLTNRQQVCQLAADVLEKVFTQFEICRPTVLMTTLTKMYIRASSKGAVVHHYSQLFAKLIRLAPTTVFAKIDELSKWFDYIPRLPGAVVRDILHGVRPLIKLNPNLRRELVKVIKVAHRSGCEHSRLMSAFGSLAVLRNLKLSLCGPGFEESIACSISLSQVATSLQVNADSSSDMNSTCFQLLSILRRSLHYSVSIKSAIYQNIPTVVSENESISCALIEMLYQHLVSLWTGNNVVQCVMSSFDLEDTLTEEFGQLVHALAECVHVVNDRLVGRNVSDMIEEDSVLTKVCANGFRIVKEVVSSVSTADLKDLNIGKDSDFNRKNPAGAQNLETAHIFNTLVQTSIQFKVRTYQSSHEASCVQFLDKLFDKLMDLSDVNKFFKPRILFSLSVLNHLVAVILFPFSSGKDENGTFSEFVNCERLKNVILKFVLQQCESCLQYNMVDEKYLYQCGAFYQSVNEDFQHVGVLIWKGIVQIIEKTESTQLNDQTKGGSYLENLLMCMTFIFKVTIARFPTSLEDFIGSLVDSNSSSDRSSLTRSASLYFQIVESVHKLVDAHRSLCSGTAPSTVVTQTLMRLLAVVTECLFGNSSTAWELKQSCQWMCKTLMEGSDLDTTSAKLLLNLTLTSCSKIQTNNFTSKVASQIFFELCEDEQRVKRPQVPVRVVNRENGESLSNELNSVLSQWLGNVGWMIRTAGNILASAAKMGSESSADFLDNIDKVELTLCNELLAVTFTLIKLLNCPLTKESSFCATISNCYLYHTNMDLFLKNILLRIQHVTRNRASPLTSEVQNLMKNSQAPMKDAVHNAMEHALGNLWHSNEVATISRKKPKKNVAAATQQPLGDISDRAVNDAQTELDLDQDTAEQIVGNDRGKAKVGKETKNIPQLVYAMEQMEVTTFKLCKHLGLESSQFISSVNLRDFRIRDDVTAPLSVAMEDNNGPPPSSRARTN